MQLVNAISLGILLFAVSLELVWVPMAWAEGGSGEQVKPGENRIEILVYHTLADHYLTIPTRYRGSLRSGLIGPVRLEAQ